LNIEHAVYWAGKLKTRIAIVSGQSLYAEGLASKLSNHLDKVDLQLIDANTQDVLEILRTSMPSVVILDDSDPDIDNLCPIANMLIHLPGLTVVRLDPREMRVNVVTSQERSIQRIDDLVNFITGDG
jgi:hypothetical protein